MSTKRSRSISFKLPIFSCINCDNNIPWNRPVKIYCSDLCRQEAHYIRYVRRCNRDGRINLPDVQEAIRIRSAHIASGGYPETERHIPKKLRESVFKRDHGVCQNCGKPGTDIDHIRGSSNEIDNLQLLCSNCHKKKTLQHIKKIIPGDDRFLEVVKKGLSLNSRIESTTPLRPCDDEENWPSLYKKILLDRKEIFYNFLSPILSTLIKKGCSTRKIAEELNRIGIPAFSGHGKWEHKAIGKVISLLDL
jgi:5-methylcytosine-specific restriction endonuclease McrA